ncbi:MAG: hypothetical protein ACP5JT_04880 [Thermoplasmata archaeon]|jgi:alanyl-tRNA synthetase
MELYYRDPYLKEIDVEIVSKDNEFLEFDRTIIFPGGGGQPSDRGILIGKDFKIKILFSKRLDGKILHKYELIEGKLDENKGKLILDWERRYKLMKMHTGEHILYRSLENLFNVKFQKVIFDENESSLFIMGSIKMEDVFEAEKFANEIIKRNLPVKEHYENISEINEDEIRIKRDRIREKNVRIIEIEGFDKSACSGIHVKNTGEVEYITVKSIKSGDFTEIKFLTGEGALRYLYENSKIIRSIENRYKLDHNVIEKKLNQMIQENEKLRKSLYELSSTMFNFNKANKNGKLIYYSDFPYVDINGIERLGRKIMENENSTVIYGNEMEGKIFLLSKDQRDIEFIRSVMEKHKLRGGGSKNYFIISIENADFKTIYDEILSFFIS